MPGFLAFIAALPRLLDALWSLHKAFERLGGENFIAEVKAATDKLEAAKSEEEFANAARDLARTVSRMRQP